MRTATIIPKIAPPDKLFGENVWAMIVVKIDVASIVVVGINSPEVKATVLMGVLDEEDVELDWAVVVAGIVVVGVVCRMVVAGWVWPVVVAITRVSF